MNLNYQGFLGSNNSLLNDLFLAVTFLISLFFIRSLLKPSTKSSNTAHILEKIEELKQSLVYLGIKVKTMTQNSRDLVVSFPHLHVKLDQIRQLLNQELSHSGNEELYRDKITECLLLTRTQIDSALETQSSLPEQTKQLSVSITETTQQILSMARLLQNFKDEVKSFHPPDSA